jgi:glycosyltransferase involved in cell wall biosynthesis
VNASGGLRTRGGRRESSPERPLISVVTVVRNGEAHLERAIRSVLDQSYDNVEYIVIDGGSTDSTLDMIRKYDDQIDCWVSEPDRGIYDAMNKGIALATGELIGLLNSDDDYLPDALSEVARAWEASPGKDVVITGRWNVLFDNKDLGITLSPSLKFHSLRICHQATFIPKWVYEAHGMYDTKYRYSADLEMAVRLHASGVPFLLLDSTLVNYRAFGASGMNFHRTGKEQSDILRRYLPWKSVFLFRMFRVKSEILTGSYSGIRRILGGEATDRLTQWYFSWKGKVSRTTRLR